MLYEKLRFWDDISEEEGVKHEEGCGRDWKRIVDCSAGIQRNMCVALGCLAEKMAGMVTLYDLSNHFSTNIGF